MPGGRKAVPKVCHKPESGDVLWECVPSCARKPDGCDQNVTDLFGKMTVSEGCVLTRPDVQMERYCAKLMCATQTATRDRAWLEVWLGLCQNTEQGNITKPHQKAADSRGEESKILGQIWFVPDYTYVDMLTWDK